jgi:hypothetical protein
MRLLLHMSMFCGLAARTPSVPERSSSETLERHDSSGDLNGGRSLPRLFVGFVNTETACTLHQDLEAKFVGEHMTRDLALLVESLSSNTEDVIAAIHEILRRLVIETERDLGVDARALNFTTRQNWEEVFEKKYLAKIVKGFEDLKETLYDKWTGGSSEGTLVMRSRTLLTLTRSRCPSEGARCPSYSPSARQSRSRR